MNNLMKNMRDKINVAIQPYIEDNDKVVTLETMFVFSTLGTMAHDICILAEELGVSSSSCHFTSVELQIAS